MIEFNGKKLCENCFSEWGTEGTFCTQCGYNPDVIVTDPTMLKPGSVLLGKYIVGKVIGKGGFGVTYVAYDTTTNKKVAIKEFFPYGVALRAPGTTTVSVSSMDNAETFKMGAEKFYNEAKLVSKFNGNPNIVGVHEFFYENDTVYFSMEYLQGHTLKEHIQEHGVLTPAQALFIFRNVSNALMAAHSQNVMHRDISPDNIILCDNGDVKLIDFGAARQVVAEHSQSFSVILKPGFAPLEQYQKKGNQGPWTDIYSLGATIYHSLTEDIPEDPMSRIDDDEEFSSNKYNIEPELWAIIKKATQLKIEDRYEDIFMLRNDLNSVSYQPEPVIVPTKAPSDKMPEIHTAVPFGMTQTVTQPVRQPAQLVAVAAGNVTPSVQPEGNPVQQVTAAQPIKKPSSKKIAAIIISSVAALVLVIGAAVIIPSVVNNSKVPTVSDDTPSSSSAQQSSQSKDYSQPTYSEPTEPTVYVPSDRVYYSLLGDDEKRIYEAIYGGLESKNASIDLPKGNYSDDTISKVYYKVLYDNPNFYYVNDYVKNGSTICPKYINLTSEEERAFENTITDIEDDLKGITSEYDIATSLHDSLVTREITLTERYVNNTCTSAFGALGKYEADDLGFAKAFCYLAQRKGLSCVVMDGTLNTISEAWCKVRIDGVWYNVDAFKDKDLTDNNIVETFDVDTSSGKIYHTFFLTNDEYMDYCDYDLTDEYIDLPSADSGYDNYYIRTDKNYVFYYKLEDLDAYYKKLIDISANKFKEGTTTTYTYVAPWLVDELWEKMDANAYVDLVNNYGISSNIVVYGRYEPDTFSLTLSYS